MAGVPLILIFLLIVAGMIYVLSKLRTHAFVTLVGLSLALGIISGLPRIAQALGFAGGQLAADAAGRIARALEAAGIGALGPRIALIFEADGGIPLAGIPGVPGSGLPIVVGVGFSHIFASIALVVLFGILIGNILETTGAAAKIADMVIRLVGKGSPTLAFMLMGWVASISVYCEAGFVALNPIRKSAAKHAGTGSIATAMGLGSGLYISHALVPFTPGPLAAAALLGLQGSLLIVLLMAVIVSVPALVGAYFFAVHIGKKRKSREDIQAAREKAARSYGQMLKKRKKLPNGLLSLSPILAPMALMVLGSISSAAGWTGLGAYIAGFVGAPFVAMIAGLMFAVALLIKTKKMKHFNPATESTLKSAGPILCIMGAGGVLGHVIAEAGVIGFVLQNAAALQSLGLFFPFLVAAVIKTAQGSSTVAMVAAAAMVAPLMGELGLDTTARAALAVMAIGAGSMVASHVNDPFFWIVTKFSGMSTRQGYMSHTVMTLIAGLCCMAGVLALSLFVR